MNLIAGNLQSHDQAASELDLARSELERVKKESADLAAKYNECLQQLALLTQAASSNSPPAPGASQNRGELQLRAICDALPAMIADFGADGRHRFANATYERWFGVSRPALSEKTLREVFGPRAFAKMSPHIEAALAGKDAHFELLLSDHSGATRYASVHLIPHAPEKSEAAGFSALIADITDRKKDEQEKDLLHAQLAGHRQRLIDLVRSVPGIVWEAWGRPDLGTQRINFVSSHVETMLGYRIEEWLANPNFWLTLAHPEDKTRAAKEAAAIFQAGVGGTSQFRWIAKDGRVLWVEANSVVIKDDHGLPIGMRGVTIDITERKRAEEAIRQLNQELELRIKERTAALQETTDQMEAFCYSVSHDLRAPLRAVQGFANALAEDYGSRLDATGKEYTERVSAAAQRMDSLIQDLLEYSRIGRVELHLAPLDLSKAVKQAIEPFAAQIARIGATVTSREPMPFARAHPGVLQQALSHLLSNALKFTRPGTPPKIEIWAEASDGKVRLCMQDNGIGIARNHFERIFRVFERLHGAETYPGTGIGLAIVKKGVERMGGRVVVESDLGAGSCFWIELTQAPEPPASDDSTAKG